jgi:hypothetical protein
MSSVKRRKVGGDIPATTKGKTASDTASVVSSSPDPEMKNAVEEDNITEAGEVRKTFKDLVYSPFTPDSSMITNKFVGNH